MLRDRFVEVALAKVERFQEVVCELLLHIPWSLTDDLLLVRCLETPVDFELVPWSFVPGFVVGSQLPLTLVVRAVEVNLLG